jgi:Cu+-exporting ATPase
VEDFANIEGLGVQGVVDGHAVLVGRPQLLAERSQALPHELAQAMTTAQAKGETAVAVGWDGKARAVLTVADQIKSTSAEAIRQLRDLGLRPVLLTGDNQTVARAVAQSVGITPQDVIAEVLPKDKVDVVKRLQSEGRTVAMIGDGVNDAAALAQADLGLAMGTGTDVAIEASDLTLVRGDLRVAADAIRLSRRTLRTIQGNLFWAFAYNVAALPLAAAGMLNPIIAGAAMAFSSIFVVTNSLRLRRFRFDRCPMFTRFDGDEVVWADGSHEHVDVVLLATGYRPGLDYLDGLGALDESGYPRHVRGLSSVHAGLGFLGLEWQRTPSSNTLRGVGRDARYLARKLKAHLGTRGL